jgi:hypothetical protein
MTSDLTKPAGAVTVDPVGAVSANAPRADGLAGDSSAPRLSGVWSRLAPSLPLVPILVALTLRSVLVHSLPGDEGSYLAYARNLTHGFYAATDLGYLWHGPGLPLLLAPLVALHVPLFAMRILAGPVLLFATLAVFHRMTRLYVADRTAVIAAYCLALYLPFWGVLGVIWVEPLATLCFTLSAFFLVRSLRGGRRDHWWAGVSLAMLALSRVEFGYVLIAALVLSVVWLLASRGSTPARRTTLAFTVGLLLCVPWLVYTYSLTSKPFYWGNSGGLSLYWMTAPDNLGDWHHASEAFTIPQLAVDRPVFTAIAGLNPVQQDTRLMHIALQNIRSHPGHYLANVVNNVGRLVFNSPYSFTSEKASSMFYGLPNALLLGLVAVAAVVAIRVRRQLGPEILPIAVLVALGFAVHVPLAAYARFTIPVVPTAAWLVIAIVAPRLRLSNDPADNATAAVR